MPGLQGDHDRPHDDDDDFPALDEKLAERLAALDETEAAQRADALRAGLRDYELDEEDARLLEAAAEDPDAHRSSCRRRRCSPSSAARTSASPRW